MQKNKLVVEEYVYPLGKSAMKAFLPTDWKFYNHNNVTININPSNSEIQEFPMKLRVTFSIQKNRQNGQKLTIVADEDYLDICLVQAAYRIFL